ncbi:MAG: phage tail family protein [Aerococcus sp.]|nr:phage tail family protein [Aerococcus sp.]
MYEMIVDQESLKDLIYITSVDRTMGPVVKNRVITVNAYIIHDVLATIDVLNKLMTGDLQKFIFTDQADRYWEGRLQEKIEPSSSEQWSKVEFNIEVPDGVAYAVEPTTVRLTGQESVTLTNNGSETCYPTFDFTTTDETYMLSVVGHDATYQYGESLDASPLKEVEVKHEEVKDGYTAQRNQLLIDTAWKNVKTESYDVSKINPNWRTMGSFSQRGGVTRAPQNGKITIAKWATNWQTGERMDNWVKGKTFPVVQTKNVNQSKSKKAYLLKNGRYYLGWVLEQDIAGGVTAGNAGDMVPNYGSSAQYFWHGPAMRWKVTGECTDFDTHTWFNFVIGKGAQMGAFYFAVMHEDTVISSIQFSSHQNNLYTWLDFYARGKGLNVGSYDKTFPSNIWGRVHMRKQGDSFTFDVMKNNKKIVKTYNIPGDNLTPTHVLVWMAQYSNFQKAQEESVVNFNFSGLNTKVWIKPHTETTTQKMNLPDPQTIIPADKMVRLEMSTNLAYVNGALSLSPVQFGSKAVGIPPGNHEVLLVCDGKQPPDCEINYREVFR